VYAENNFSKSPSTFSTLLFVSYFIARQVSSCILEASLHLMSYGFRVFNANNSLQEDVSSSSSNEICLKKVKAFLYYMPLKMMGAEGLNIRNVL
jgi:hypothetical protein